MKKSVFAVITAFIIVFCINTYKGDNAMKVFARENEVSIHDPSIIRDNDGSYYVFGSHITTAKSNDLINWEYVARGYKREGNVHFGTLSENLKGSFKWAGEDDGDCKGGFAVWAPDVYYNERYIWSDGTKGAYMMYYSASSTYKRSCIGLAVSRDIEGPYEYVDTVIYSGFTKNKTSDENSTHNNRYTNTNIDELIEKGRITTYKDDWGIDDYNNIKYPNAIDPCVYKSKEGRLYLTYGSWSGGIFTLPINEVNGLLVYPGVDGETDDGRMIDRYFGTHIAGGKGWSGEGAFIWYDEEAGFYYLQTSYEWLGTDGGYHIRMFRAESPTGPFVDICGNNAVYGSDMAKSGVKLFGNYYFKGINAPYTSGGHCSTLVDENGERYLFYHTRFKGTEHFVMRVHKMFLNEDKWPCIAPYSYSGETKREKCFTDEEIVGVYEYINHDNKIGEGTAVRESSMIMLLATGEIKGAVSGNWFYDGNNLTFKIDGETYKGLFLEQIDEKGNKALAFTLIGGENCAVWGVKTFVTNYRLKEAKTHISFDDELNNVVRVIKKPGADPVEDSLNSIKFTEGKIGKAARFDGNYGLRLDGAEIKEDFTISFWMNADRMYTYSPVVTSSETFFADGKDKWFSLTNFDNGKTSVIWSHNGEKGQWMEGKNSGIYKMGKWQHVTLVFNSKYFGGYEDAISCRLYINGLCTQSGSVTKHAFTKDSKLYFGINPWDKCFEGLIDDIKIFDYAFSHADAMANYYSYGI